MRGRGGSIYTLDGGAGGVVLDGDTRWEGARSVMMMIRKERRSVYWKVRRRYIGRSRVL